MKYNILLVGLGSIGTMHLNSLYKLGYKNIFIVSRSGKAKKGFEQFRFYSSINEACSEQKINIAIVSTPTAEHTKNLVDLLSYKIKNIYLEKPISHSLVEIRKVEKILNNSDTNLVVGYDLHFDPGLLLIKNYIHKNKIGKVISFIAEVGQYLPDWRPNTDYKKSMSARKSLGGGVMLDLVHEFDYLNWLIGPIKSISGKNNKISNLDIDTEDVSVNIIETTSGALGTLHLDYMQYELSRKCKIIGEKGVLIWDYSKGNVMFMSHKDKTWRTHDFSNYKREDRFLDIMNSFMNSIKSNHDERLVNFHDAKRSLELVEAAKKSNIDNKLVSL